MTGHIVATWFGIMWCLCLVPTLAMEFVVAHLRIELGEVSDRKKNQPARPVSRE